MQVPVARVVRKLFGFDGLRALHVCCGYAHITVCGNLQGMSPRQFVANSSLVFDPCPSKGNCSPMNGWEYFALDERIEHVLRRYMREQYFLELAQLREQQSDVVGVGMYSSDGEVSSYPLVPALAAT